jgi:hypothetical protein
MLNGEGCQELDWLHLDTSHDATVLDDVPKDMHMLVG